MNDIILHFNYILKSCALFPDRQFLIGNLVDPGKYSAFERCVTRHCAVLLIDFDISVKVRNAIFIRAILLLLPCL